MNFFYLFLFSIISLVTPIICFRIRFPLIVGEILAGIILALFMSGKQVDITFIEHLSQLGFIFLMFLAGMEINFEHFQPKKIILPIFQIILITLQSIFVGMYFFHTSHFFICILLSCMSVGLVFLSLKSADSEKTAYGQHLIWTASLGELVSILSLIIYEIAHKNNNQFQLVFLKDLSGIIIVLVVSYLGIQIFMLLLWQFPLLTHLLNKKIGSDTISLSVRLAFLVLLTMATLSHFFQVEIILGAFLGGMMLSFIFRSKSFFEAKLNSIGYGFFIPFFFIHLGWSFAVHTRHFEKILTIGIQLYGLILLSRLPMLLIFAYLMKTDTWYKKFTTSLGSLFLMSAPLTILIVTAQLGYDLHIISHDIYRGAIVAAMIGGIMGPIGFTFFRNLYKWIDVRFYSHH